MLLNSVLGSRQVIALGIGLALAMPLPAHASRIWDWSYAGTGIAASGTFTTTDTANGSGYYQIVGITGSRNGETITGLQPTGTPIPGNEPYAVDNLISLGAPQLTINGFGFSTAAGDFANPFYANFLPSPGYLEFFSAPPFTPVIGPEDSELPVIFTAALTTTGVPEPAAAGLLLVGLVGLVAAGAGRGGLGRLRSMTGTRLMREPRSDQPAPAFSARCHARRSFGRKSRYSIEASILFHIRELCPCARDAARTQHTCLRGHVRGDRQGERRLARAFGLSRSEEAYGG